MLTTSSLRLLHPVQGIPMPPGFNNKKAQTTRPGSLNPEVRLLWSPILYCPAESAATLSTVEPKLLTIESIRIVGEGTSIGFGNDVVVEVVVVSTGVEFN